MDQSELRQILDFAVEIAQSAGTLTLGYFNSDTPHETKQDNTPVTIADRNAEEQLRHRINHRFPTHGILGEEYGEKKGVDPGRWILDPIDGTQSFISGVPLYAVLVGFEWNAEVVVGVIHLPALRETVYAAKGLGCWWNGRPARVSNVSELGQARLIATSPRTCYEQGRGAAYERLRDASRVDRGWSDAYGYALLATGRAEVVIDPIMSIWDTAALVPVVTEAGGTLTDWNGFATHVHPEALATNGRLFEAVLATIQG